MHRLRTPSEISRWKAPASVGGGDLIGSSAKRGDMANEIPQAIRWITVSSVIAFLAVLVWYLGQPGYSHVRLAFFVALGLLAVAGAVGAVRHSAPLVALGSGGLFLLGFWQAALWVYIYPVVALLVLAALLDGDSAETSRTPS